MQQARQELEAYKEVEVAEQQQHLDPASFVIASAELEQSAEPARSSEAAQSAEPAHSAQLAQSAEPAQSAAVDAVSLAAVTAAPQLHLSHAVIPSASAPPVQLSTAPYAVQVEFIAACDKSRAGIKALQPERSGSDGSPGTATQQLPQHGNMTVPNNIKAGSKALQQGRSGSESSSPRIAALSSPMGSGVTAVRPELAASRLSAVQQGAALQQPMQGLSGGLEQPSSAAVPRLEEGAFAAVPKLQKGLFAALPQGEEGQVAAVQQLEEGPPLPAVPQLKLHVVSKVPTAGQCFTQKA